MQETMLKDSAMSEFLNIKLPFFGTLLASIFFLPTFSSASGYITKIDKNGKITASEATKYFRGTLKCGGVKAILSLDDIKGKKPSIMAVVVETDGSKTYPTRLISEFDGFIESHHSMNDFEIGCLSGDGGIGMIFKSTDDTNENSFIQLDGSGRIFSNFNQTGFTLLPSTNSE